MKKAPIPPHDNERVKTLRSYDVLDTPPERVFDDIVKVAAHVLDAPIALVSLVDVDRQWFKARYGLDASQTPRDVSFCGHVVADQELLVVNDAAQDDRFKDNPLVTKDPRVVFYAGAPLRSPEGHVLGTLCAIDHEAREVSAAQLDVLRALANQVMELLELRRTGRENAAHRRLADSQLSCVANFDGYLTRIGRAWESFLGYTEEELTSRPYVEFILEEDRQTAMETAGRAIAGDVVVEYSCRFVAKNGELRWTQWHVTADPARQEIYASGSDVTTLHSAQVELIEVEKEVRRLLTVKKAILDGAAYAIIATHADGTIRLFNQAAERMLGYSADEMVEKQMPGAFHKPSEVVARAAELSEELGRSIEPGFEAFVAKARLGNADEREWTYVRKDGTEFPVRLSVTALTGENGEPVGFLGIAADITDLKAVQKMQSEFVSTVSHELRTPLTSIRGSLGLLAGGAVGDLDPKVRQLVSLALTNCDRLVRLINDILDVERIESGKMVLHASRVELDEALRSAVASTQPFADQYHVEYGVGPIPPNLAVTADPDRLAQVLTNLLSNAAKFSPQGGKVEIMVDEGGTRHRVSVRDHGKGISDEFRNRIFKRFSQSDASDSRQRGGTGLGLSISKALVEKMGGEIGFDDAPGGGSIFWFELPLAGAAAPALSERGTVPQSQSSEPILLVEDDIDAAEVLTAQMEQWGYEVLHAATISEAEKLLRDQLFAAAMLDVGLPDGNGLMLCSRIRSGEFGQTPPCIIVSARPEDDRFSKPIWMDWIEKPPVSERLRAALAEANLAGSQSRIMLIEDDEDCRTITESMLESAGHEVLAVATAEDALGAVLDFAPDLLILDLGLPGMSGFDFVEALKRTDAKSTPLIVYTGRELLPEDVDQLSLGVTKCLTKSSVSKDQFLSTVQNLISSHII